MSLEGGDHATLSFQTWKLLKKWITQESFCARSRFCGGLPELIETFSRGLGTNLAVSNMEDGFAV